MRSTLLPPLARKYRTLLALRVDHARDGAAADRERLRALAAEFPGALRELDTLPAEELEARAAALEAAADGGAVEPWMNAMAGYHALMGTALAVKRAYAAGETAEGDGVRAAVEALRAECGITLDGGDLAAIATPPQGRLGVFVFGRLGRALGRDPAELWQATFPTGRADRFTPRHKDDR